MKHYGYYAYVGIAAALCASNFAYQAWQAIPNWHAAIERSYFELIAVGACGILMGRARGA